MNIQPAFKHLLPAEEPSDLARLADAAIAAADWLHICPDALWNAASDAEIETQNAFRDRLTAETGLSPKLLADLAKRGII